LAELIEDLCLGLKHPPACLRHHRWLQKLERACSRQNLVARFKNQTHTAFAYGLDYFVCTADNITWFDRQLLAQLVVGNQKPVRPICLLLSRVFRVLGA